MCFNTDQVNPPTRQTHKRIASTTSKPANQQTSKPANQQTSKPANQQTSKPANQQTSKPANQQTRPNQASDFAALSDSDRDAATCHAARRWFGWFGWFGRIGVCGQRDDRASPASPASQASQTTCPNRTRTTRSTSKLLCWQTGLTSSCPTGSNCADQLVAPNLLSRTGKACRPSSCRYCGVPPSPIGQGFCQHGRFVGAACLPG